jgi:hypothetical protein
MFYSETFAQDIIRAVVTGDNVNIRAEPSSSIYTEKAETTSTIDWNNYNKRAEQLVSALIDGYYSEVVTGFNNEMKEALSVSALKKAWEDTVTVAGDFIEFAGTENFTHDIYMVCEVTTRHKTRGIITRVVFDSDGLVAGLFLRFTK